MLDYCLYILDTRNGIIRTLWMFCRSDDNALAEAAKLVTIRQGVEVRHMNRLVGTLPPRKRTEWRSAA